MSNEKSYIYTLEFDCTNISHEQPVNGKWKNNIVPGFDKKGVAEERYDLKPKDMIRIVMFRTAEMGKEEDYYNMRVFAAPTSDRIQDSIELEPAHDILVCEGPDKNECRAKLQGKECKYKDDCNSDTKQVRFFNITEDSSPGEEDYFTNLIVNDPSEFVSEDNKLIQLSFSAQMIYNPGSRAGETELSGINNSQNETLGDCELFVVFGDPHKGKAKIKCKRD